jgi:hypothetical protein
MSSALICPAVSPLIADGEMDLIWSVHIPPYCKKAIFQSIEKSSYSMETIGTANLIW